MTADRIDGFVWAIFLVLIFVVLVIIDKYYLNSRIANLFKQTKFRLVFMILIFIIFMLSSFYRHTYGRL